MNSTVIDRSAPPAELRTRVRAPMTTRDLLTPVFFFQRRAILAFLIPLVLSLAAAISSHPVFTADARLLILLGDEYVYRGVGDTSQGFMFDRAQIVHSEMEILTSRDLRIATLQAMGVGRVYPGTKDDARGLQEAADRLDKDLAVDNVPQSNVVSLSLHNRDPQIAAQTLNTLIRLYLQRRPDVFAQADPNAMSGQRDQLSTRLAQVEAQLSTFAAQHGFGDYNQAFQAAQTQADALTAQLQSLDEQLAARAGRGAELQHRKAAEPGEVDLAQDLGRSQELDALTQNLVALQSQRRLAAARYVDGSPIVADLDRRIAQLQAQIAKTPSQQVAMTHRAVNPLRQQLDTQIADAQADAAGLRQGREAVAAALRQANARLLDLVAIGPKYRELQRERSLLETAFTDLNKRVEDARASDSLSRSHANVRVLQSASAPSHGKAGRILLLVGGLAVGLVAAGAMVLLSSALFEGMLSPRDAEEKLGLPAIMAIAERQPRARPDEPLPSAQFLGPEDADLLDRLVSTVAVSRGRVLQMIGAGPQVGVSSLAVDYALLAAREGGRVLLLDLEPEQGSSDVELLQTLGGVAHDLPGGRLVRFGEGAARLDVTRPHGPRELAHGEASWARLMEEARKYYDLILVDAPPLVRSRLGQLLAPHVDVTLIVVAAESTRAAVALHVVERIRATGGDVIASVLNRRRFYIPARLYRWL